MRALAILLGPVLALVLAGCAIGPGPSQPVTSAGSMTPAGTPVPTPAPPSGPVLTAVALADGPPPKPRIEVPLGAVCPPSAQPIQVDRTASFAGQPVSLMLLSGESRVGGGGWSDAVPGPTARYGSGPRLLEALPVDSLATLMPSARITLIAGSLEVYSIRSDGTLDASARPVAARMLGGQRAGLTIPLPVVPGRWLASVSFEWQTPCLAGNGYLDVDLTTGP